MICNKCGQEITKGVELCPNCGAKGKKNLFRKFFGFKIVKMLLPILIFITIGIFLFYHYDAIKYFKKNNTLSQEQINTIIPSIVSIFCPNALDQEGKGNWGSGTIYDKTGKIITNSHVIPQIDEIITIPKTGCTVSIPDPITGRPMEKYYAKPIIIPKLSKEYDLAFLEIYQAYTDKDNVAQGQFPKEFKSFNLVSIQGVEDNNLCDFREDFKLGESIKIFGYPAASGNTSITITEGVISNLPNDDKTILTSAKIDSGNSGGLAIDSDGCPVGIPTAVSVGDYENYGVIIKNKLVVKFMGEYMDYLVNKSKNTEHTTNFTSDQVFDKCEAAKQKNINEMNQALSKCKTQACKDGVTNLFKNLITDNFRDKCIENLTKK